MNPILYRRASPADLDQLNDLHVAAYSEFERSLPEDGWKTLSTNLHDKTRLREVFANSRAFIGETNGKIVGMAFLVSSGNPTTIYPDDWSYIRMVGVHPSFRGYGIGKRLTMMCIDEAKNSSEKTIGLHTSEVMNAARHVYESLGFKVFKEIDKIFGVRYWLYKIDL
jgi:ribosomal protein S18 acetylase RimI-like enzyme